MSQPSFTIENIERRSRLTTLFRGLLVIPHHFVMTVWQWLVQLLSFVQWWIILFTGKRSEGIWRMQNSWLSYAARVWSYYGLMYDKWPNFGAEPNGEPTTYSFEYTAGASRVKNFFRFIMIIPAAIVAIVVLIGAEIVTGISWFAIVITGKHPQGMFGFLLKVHRYMVRLSAYGMMMTDTYPKYGA
jgi:hypothetical protein